VEKHKFVFFQQVVKLPVEIGKAVGQSALEHVVVGLWLAFIIQAFQLERYLRPLVLSH
jgi:hypothetical protein